MACLALALVSGSAYALNPDGSDNIGEGETGTGFPNVLDFADTGPFATTDGNEGPNCRVFRPTALGENGLQHPVIVWGNGTGTTPTSYRSLLEHWASHGFVVAAARTSNAGSGEQMLECLNYLEQQNASGSGVYAGNLDMGRVGTSGHSQGGGGSIMAGRDSRVTTTAPVQPYILGLGHDSSSQSQQNGPMFLMSGSRDTLAGPVLNQRPVFNRANVPVFWGTLNGAGHFEPVGDGGDYRGPSTAWFRYQLMDDDNASAEFLGSNCGLCGDRSWDVETKDM
ncbi:alpha/beta hydrolase [Alkalilimnicola ehrlichii]|uniref:Alpha/beta hydrolase n=1 Tax=Alkalilimnicola ehrlichii TaxID=351052 RepID=A0A3E0WW00_9GAMM|nr:alpha/beta hydrolase [Alkalilimnicola ehrlichii]RFA36176.1 alpha/beta hydrolase [Alkalilimnicola ehrlichii]